MNRCLLGVAVCCLLSGCVWRTQIERGVLSTYKIDFDKCYEVDRAHRISGADRAHSIWIIPFGSPDATEAFDKTIADANKTTSRKIVGIADAEVKFKFLKLWLYSQRWYSVEGYPIYEKQ